jgi:hypothetical protein
VSAAETRSLRVAVVADDLIWATRLVDAVRRAGAVAVAVRRASDVPAALAGADGVIVDTSARAYDPLAVLRAARDAGVPSIAAGPHDDPVLRRAALDAGAGKVHPYRELHERGDRVIARWLASLAAPA